MTDKTTTAYDRLIAALHDPANGFTARLAAIEEHAAATRAARNATAAPEWAPPTAAADGDQCGNCHRPYRRHRRHYGQGDRAFCPPANSPTEWERIARPIAGENQAA